MTESLTFDVAGRAIASALLHSVWEGALIASATALALRMLRGATAQARYVVACAALAALFGAFTITATRSAAKAEGGLQTALPPTAPILGPGPFDFSPTIRNLSASELDPGKSPAPWPARLERWSVAAVPLWLAGVLLLSLRLSAGWIALTRLRRSHLAPVAPDLGARVSALAHRVRVSRPVRVAHSAAIRVPSVVGWLRPVILLPASALSGLSPAQLDAVIAHELGHIRRHDFAVNALQTAADVLLFYHPACWWLSRRIRVEREHCCDDIAVAVCGDRVVYATALVNLEALRQQTALVLAATDGPLLQRVRRLVAPLDRDGGRTWPVLVLPLAIVGIVIGGVVTRAQQGPEQTRVPGMGRTIPGDRGVIEGQIVEAGSGRPIAGARVETLGPSDQMYVITDQAGRYETRPLAPGAYALSVTAPGYARTSYDGRAGSLSGQSSVAGSLAVSERSGGATRISINGNLEIRATTTLDVRAGSLLSNIDVALQVNSQLSGRILDGRGRGLAGAHIQLVPSQGSLIDVLPRVAYARSESDGTYRMTAAPGDYIVHAYADRPVRQSGGVALAYLSTFYPGVRSRNEAQAIRLDPGVEHYDVDFALLSSRAVRVSGVVVDPSGTDLEDVSVRLGPHAPLGSGNTSVQLQLNARGEFDARGVVPGTYQIDVIDPRRPERWKTPRQPLEIDDDVTGLDIRAVRPASITGRVVKDPRSAGRINLTQTVMSFGNWAKGAGMSGSAFNLDEDGSFHGELSPGSLTVSVMGPAGWTTRAIRLDGQDVFGYALEITPGAHEIEVVVTDRLSSVSGLVVDRRGTPLGGFDVVLFPQDEARWLFMSPFIRQTRSSQNGRFELTLLPPGDYLSVATEGVPFLMLGDPAAALRSLQSIGTRLTVGDGEQKTISIRASPSPLAP